MPHSIEYNLIAGYVDDNLSNFRKSMVHVISALNLNQLLSELNPYTLVERNKYTVSNLIKSITDAHISSTEEAIFGDWLEGLAIFINNKVYNGQKPAIRGIDLEFVKDNVRYIVNIKSGPKWHNKSQRDKMLNEFSDAKRTLATSDSKLQVVAVNGCCYGRDNKPQKFPAKGTDYLKLCGQRFWEFISGDSELFTKIIEPLGHLAKERNDDFLQSYAQMVNKFTMQFGETFFKENHSIDWDKLVRFNSAISLPRQTKRKNK